MQNKKSSHFISLFHHFFTSFHFVFEYFTCSFLHFVSWTDLHKIRVMMFNFLPLVGNRSRIVMEMIIIFSMPWLRLSCLVTYSNIAFLLHSSQGNDDMSVLVAVIHIRVGYRFLPVVRAMSYMILYTTSRVRFLYDIVRATYDIAKKRTTSYIFAGSCQSYVRDCIRHQYILFYWFGTAFLSFLQGTYGHILRTSDSSSEYSLCSSCVFCGPAGHCRFASKRFMLWNTHSTKAHYIRFINCCLAGPLPVPASAWHYDWALALACWGMQLRRVSFARLTVVKLPRWWSVACSPAAPALASGRLKDLGFKLCRW